MNISEKISNRIEDIRRQPEHIRLKYAWGAVAFSMFFIVAIWIFSLGSLFKGDYQELKQKNPTGAGLTDQLKTIKEQAPSVEGFTNPNLTTEKGSISDMDTSAYSSSTTNVRPSREANLNSQ